MVLGLLKTSKTIEEVEDVAIRYMKVLWSRGFLEDFRDIYFHWEFKVHDLATSMAKDESAFTNFGSQNVDGKFQHFSHAAKKYGDESIVGSFIGKDISKFKYLQLLHLCDILFEVLPDSIGTLRHLRLKKLPNNMRKMICLRHLEITTQEEVLPENGIGCLSSLQYLCFFACSNLVSLCEGMHGLKSLRMLHLRNTSVRSLPDTIKYLTKLEILLISYSSKINLKMDLQAEDRGLRLSLKTFIIYYLESLVDLPQLLLQTFANTLKTMQIGYCKNLEALPEWFQYLTSLETLDITNCSRLLSLPQGMERLTSLKLLKIENCPPLVESCRNDESKIAHIP
ncbi:probable disease resistance protein RPP1 [Pistacia vera]|uniref:probable disease resistance protein RPP1 n=1 Tax=Pistacia vera TaxID=55513 RepID=UPI001262FBF8|nr:probable disease resistance protein RPP1 [Pistacia vera]